MNEDELRAKAESLLRELQRKIWHEEFWGNVNYRGTLGLLGVATLASVTAGILGLSLVSTRIVGFVAFIPGALTLFATSFNFQQRSIVHLQKAMLFKHLKGRFEYEMPTPPSADQIALIHREMTEIETRTDPQQNAIPVNFDQFRGGNRHI